MKTILLSLLSVILLSSQAFAGEKESKRIAYAVSVLSAATQGGGQFKVKAGNAKEMLKQLAMSEQGVESEEEFESNWVGDSDHAWEADSMNWGTTNQPGAYSYVTSAIDDNLENSEKRDADKIKFANDMLAAKKAFAILRTISTVKYGVAPMGAVQCGVTFSSLMILDTETGDIYQIVMEGSGC